MYLLKRKHGSTSVYMKEVMHTGWLVNMFVICAREMGEIWSSNHRAKMEKHGGKQIVELQFVTFEAEN